MIFFSVVFFDILECHLIFDLYIFLNNINLLFLYFIIILWLNVSSFLILLLLIDCCCKNQKMFSFIHNMFAFISKSIIYCIRYLNYFFKKRISNNKFVSKWKQWKLIDFFLCSSWEIDFWILTQGQNCVQIWVIIAQEWAET